MFNYSGTCPFIEQSSCSEKCTFYLHENGPCIFKRNETSNFEYESSLKTLWKYTDSSESLESEFYIWDKDKDVYEIVKWQYAGFFQDF